jgi:hypothetical protein
MRNWSAQKVRSRIQFQALDGSLGPIITCKQLLHIAVLERLMVFIGKRFGSAILATLWRYSVVASRRNSTFSPIRLWLDRFHPHAPW